MKRPMSLETRRYFREKRSAEIAQRRSAAEREAATAAAAVFNAQFPVGTPVRYWTFTREGEARIGRTRSVAWVVGGHSASVLVEGCTGGVHLSHVEIIA